MISFLSNLFYLSFAFIFFPVITINNSVLSTHSIAKIILLVVFLLVIFLGKKISINRNIYLLSLFFLLSVSISIFFSSNLLAFFKVFQNYFFSYIFFLLCFVFIDKSENFYKILYIILFSIFISNIIQLLIYYQPHFFLDHFSFFLRKSYIWQIKGHLSLNQVYFESYGEFFVILMFFLFLKKQKKTILINNILITVTALISNFRGKIVLVLLGILISLGIFIKKNKKIWFEILLIFLLVFVIFEKNNLFKRFSLRDYKADIYTIEVRINRINDAIKIWENNIFFGIGLGNFDYKDVKSLSTSKNTHNLLANIMVETGILGLFSYLFLILYVFKQGLKYKNIFLKKIIFSSFVLFILNSMFNPVLTINAWCIFWLFIFLLEKDLKL